MPEREYTAAERARFWQRVDVGDCWEWTGALHKGYGRFCDEPAHRVAYRLLVGPIPAGLTLDHLCRNRGCVNPDHLEPCTRGENVQRGIVGLAEKHKTHCPRGHAYTPANTQVAPNGSRQCRECRRAKNRRWYDATRRKGSHPSTKLSEAQVRELRAWSAVGIAAGELAEAYGISRDHVVRILNFKSRKAA